MLVFVGGIDEQYYAFIYCIFTPPFLQGVGNLDLDLTGLPNHRTVLAFSANIL